MNPFFEFSGGQKVNTMGDVYLDNGDAILLVPETELLNFAEVTFPAKVYVARSDHYGSIRNSADSSPIRALGGKQIVGVVSLETL